MPMTEEQAEKECRRLYPNQPIEEMCGPHTLLGRRIWECWVKKGGRLATRFLEEEGTVIKQSFSKLEELVPSLNAQVEQEQLSCRSKHEAEVSALKSNIEAIRAELSSKESELQKAISMKEKEARDFELEKQRVAWEQSNKRVILIAAIAGFFGGVFSSFYLLSRGDAVSVAVGSAMLVSTLVGCGVAVFGRFELIDISNLVGLGVEKKASTNSGQPRPRNPPP